MIASISWAQSALSSNRPLLLCVVLLGSVRSAVAQQTGRDSSGVEIVTAGPRSAARIAFELSPQPIMDVGGAESDPDKEFHHRQGYLRGIRLSDGRLVVIDVFRVHYFSAAGSREIVVGRRGSGPGEFLDLTSLCRTRGDTVVVADANNRRYSVLDPTGKIVKSFPQGDLGYAGNDFCFNDGTIVLQGMSRAGAAGSLSVRLNRVRIDGSLLDTLGSYQRGQASTGLPSEVTVAASGQSYYYGDPSTRQVDVHRLNTRQKLILRNADSSATLTDREIDAMVERMMPTTASSPDQAARIGQLRERLRNQAMPAYRRFLVDPIGRVWMQDFRTSRDTPDGWTAFDSTGRMIGRLKLPELKPGEREWEVISFGRDDVLVRRADAEGGAHLTLYRLIQR